MSTGFFITAQTRHGGQLAFVRAGMGKRLDAIGGLNAARPALPCGASRQRLLDACEYTTFPGAGDA